MTKISDLPNDVVDDNILSRVPLTCLKPVRSTCKHWYNSSKNQILGQAAARKQFLGFVRNRSRVCSMVFDLQGIHNNHDDFVDPSIKQLGKLKISDIFHCDGLLLCTTKDQVTKDPWLLLWNPYLGQQRWIKPIKDLSKVQGIKRHIFDDVYTLGYDTNNHNHKIFRIFIYRGDITVQFLFKLYDLNSHSWRVLNVSLDWIPWCLEYDRVSLKGNTYFFRRIEGADEEAGNEAFLVCFDFTAERFEPRLPLPFHIPDDFDTVNLSCVRDEQLVVLYQRSGSSMVEIWFSTKIEPNEISWSKFLNADMTPWALNGFQRHVDAGKFFIDEEKKVLVVFNAYEHEPTEIAYVVGENGYFKTMNIEESLRVRKPNPPASRSYRRRDFKLTSYVPSLVQLGKRKEREKVPRAIKKVLPKKRKEG